MMQNDLISVITIFFNAEKYIEEAVKSIFDQTYSNWELLLVDDGSSDRSTEIAKNYSYKFSHKIRYLEHPGHLNKGMSSSRNLGIDHARGNLICFLDADDIWMPEKLEEQQHIMQQCPDVSMVYGNTLFWWSWSEKNHKKDYIRRLGVNPNSVINPPELVPMFLMVSAAVPGTCSIMCRKELFNTIRFEDSFRGLYEDQAFYYKVCLSEKVYVSDKIWDKYRQHPDSACFVAEKNRELYKRRSDFLIWLFTYLNKQKYDDPIMSLAISQEFFKNRILNHVAQYKSSDYLRWLLKWFFLLQNKIIPRYVSLFFWKKSKTFKTLSDALKNNYNRNSQSVVLDYK